MRRARGTKNGLERNRKQATAGLKKKEAFGKEGLKKQDEQRLCFLIKNKGKKVFLQAV